MLDLSSKGFRVIAPYLRGFGDTDAPPCATIYTVFHIVADLVGLLDSLGLDRVFLVGHDWGAIMACVQWLQETPSGVYQYFIKVVPTIHTNIRGHTIQSNQFSVTEHFKNSGMELTRSVPGVFFFYDLSPIKVTFTEEHTSFLHFLTHICAIMGGVFTVAGIVDSFIYHGQKALRKKQELGKLR